MRLTRIAAVVVIVPALLAAQETARPDTPRVGALEAQIHYATGGDAWFLTNKPAYVALFDVSRGGVAQLYPTFSAQATELSGTSVRVEMRSPAPLGGGPFGGSSLVPLTVSAASMTAAGWPHTLLLVASTMPLRISNSWSSNIAINNDLVREHRWNDLDTDAGIASIVDLVRPQDWGAEVATDQVALATPARYTASLSYDPNRNAVTYSCVDATRSFLSPVALLGASCVALREFPASTALNAARASVAAAPNGAVDTARAPSQTRASARGTSRISEQKQADVRSINDPAEIRKFIESMKGGQAGQGPSGEPAASRHDHERDAMPASGRSGGMNARNADGSPAYGGSGGAAAHNNQEREAHHRDVEMKPATPPAAQRPSPAPSTPPPTPIKPSTERD